MLFITYYFSFVLLPLVQLIVTMKTLIVTLTFACFLSLSVAMAINTSLSTRTLGLCEYVVRQTPPGIPGAFIPSCDFNGNFLPQQCAKSTGSCWCVNVITGEEIPNTRTPPGTVPVNCGEERGGYLVHLCLLLFAKATVTKESFMFLKHGYFLVFLTLSFYFVNWSFNF